MCEARLRDAEQRLKDEEESWTVDERRRRNTHEGRANALRETIEVLKNRLKILEGGSDVAFQVEQGQ